MSTLVFFAQATNATNAVTAAAPDAANQAPLWATMLPYVFLIAIGYFLFIRPQSVAQKKQAEKLKTAKTGDKIVTSSGIHGVIANVKDTHLHREGGRQREARTRKEPHRQDPEGVARSRRQSLIPFRSCISPFCWPPLASSDSSSGIWRRKTPRRAAWRVWVRSSPACSPAAWRSFR